ncbi:hypothetical protein OROGR_010132 [Orobanche gracilis]
MSSSPHPREGTFLTIRVFLDVVESVNILVNSNGQIIGSDIVGALKMRTYLRFHQCVRLARFENDRTISFIPPDGSFDLMTYRLSTQLSTATNVEIELPVPPDATNPNVRTSMGSSSYVPEKDSLVWKIKSFPGGKEYMLRAEFRLPSITSEESTPERGSYTSEI